MKTSPAFSAAIVGAGSIGIAFAVVFARAGCQVRLFDASPERRKAVRVEIRSRLHDLESFRLLETSVTATEERVQIVASLDELVRGADLIQECVPEQLELKQQIFSELLVASGPDAIIASSSSFIAMSRIVDGSLPGHARCLVLHPENPPHLIPVIEVVPAAFTSTDCTGRCIRLLRSVGMQPVLVRKEVEGFIFNRLQGAVLREAYCLVRDGVASVEDIDTVVRDGLAIRWSVVGPFETADLNQRGGIASHAQKMGPAYERIGAERGQHDPWTPELVSQVEARRRAALPLDQWESRVAWRDRELMRLARCRLIKKKGDGYLAE